MTPSKLREQLGSASPRDVGALAFTVISSLQNNPDKGTMLAGLCSAFVLVSEQAGISPSELMVYTKNIMSDGQDRLPQFKAVSTFITKEIL